MQSSGVAVLLAVQIPPTATVGQSYNLNVLYPSATSNGIEGTVTITNMASQTLTLSAPRYMVGDSAPANGYNAGAFGNDILNNSDVNNAIYASMNIRVPPANSDLFNAMDAYPPTSVSGKGGDGAIHFLDWATILDRSLGGVAIFAGLDTNNYERFWAVGANGWPSNQVIDWSPSGPPATLSISQDSSEPELTKLSAGGKPPGLVWLSQALLCWHGRRRHSRLHVFAAGSPSTFYPATASPAFNSAPLSPPMAARLRWDKSSLIRRPASPAR